MKLSEIAARLGCELQGDGDLPIAGVKTIDEAGPEDLTFVANKKYFAKLSATKAAAVILLNSLHQPQLQPGLPLSVWLQLLQTALSG